MYLTLQIRCDTARLWDGIRIWTSGEEGSETLYETEVYIGQDHRVALFKAIQELEAQAVKLFRWELLEQVQ
jgi:hypothetical protein